MKRKKKELKSSKDILIENIKTNNNKIPFNELVDMEYKKFYIDSWFSIKKSKLNSHIDFKTTIDNNINEKIIKCKKIVLLPTEEQQKILLDWFESYRKCYNEAIYIIKKLLNENNKKALDFKYVRTYKMKEIKITLTEQSNINSHILDGAIKLACTSYKSAISNYKNGHIKHFRIRYIKQSKKSKIMDIEKCYFNTDGFCIRTLGKMENNCNFKYDEINNDCKLHYNSITKRFILLVPYYEDCKINNNNNFISIDPGIKTFLTCLTNNRTYKIGTNLQKHITKDLNELDKFASFNNKLGRKRMIKIRSRIHNKITDLHWKTINYILNKKQLKNVFIGDWSTKNTASCLKNMDPISKKISLSLRYYEFLQKLEYKCKEYNSNFILVDESYTSKICSHCSNESSINKNRLLMCNCGVNLDRDINGCINILLKNY